MIDKRPFSSLGHADHGWLNARHHFSFAEYHDADRMGWGSIRVWNDDEIAGRKGFPPHSHRDMEIITYVRQGAITHRDSLGNHGRTAAGDVQVMSAGAGVEHSEYNGEDQETRLFQIWVVPRSGGGDPRWDAKTFPKGDRAGELEILASGFAEDIAAGAAMIRADARLYGATLKAGKSLSLPIEHGMPAYLVVSTGSVDVNGTMLDTRDAAAIRDESEIVIMANEDAEFLLAVSPDIGLQ